MNRVYVNFLGRKKVFRGRENWFKRLVRRAAKVTLRREKKKGTISITLTDDRVIRRYNRQYRAKDRPTDVLSFSQDEPGIWGDILISVETAVRNAAEAWGREIALLTVHGTLHLLGYDHKKQREAKLMRGKEVNLLKEIKC